MLDSRVSNLSFSSDSADGLARGAAGMAEMIPWRVRRTMQCAYLVVPDEEDTSIETGPGRRRSGGG